MLYFDIIPKELLEIIISKFEYKYFSVMFTHVNLNCIAIQIHYQFTVDTKSH
jgi:hypothetical protein